MRGLFQENWAKAYGKLAYGNLEKSSRKEMAKLMYEYEDAYKKKRKEKIHIKGTVDF